MRAAVIQFPGSNCDRDLQLAFDRVGGAERSQLIWHKESELPKNLDMIGIPGGFSFGDYLRCGAIAARSPIMQSVVKFAQSGGYVIGICNGFQVLCETGLLPGALMRNAGLKFICKPVELLVHNTNSIFTQSYKTDAKVTYPIAHHDGNYNADSQTLARLKDENCIAFRYVNNPNGSADNIAGILSQNRRVLGLMPHPERASDPELGHSNGQALFESLATGF